MKSKHTAEVLALWARIFTQPSVWISDQSSYFKNDILTHLASTHEIRHQVTVTHSLWVNGIVESATRAIFSATLPLLGELKLSLQDWPAVISIVSTALNASSHELLGRSADDAVRTLLKAMTGIPPRTTITHVFPSPHAHLTISSLPHARAQQVLNIAVLQKALDNMHKDVECLITQSRCDAITKHNKATNLVTSYFPIDDLFLVRRATNRGGKLRFRGFGQCRITAVYSALMYGVSSLVTNKTEYVH